MILTDLIVDMYLSALTVKSSIRLRIREMENKND